MIRVSIDLVSAIDSSRDKELGRMLIANDGTSAGDLRHYTAKTLRGRSASALNAGQVQRQCRLENWPSEKHHVWNMVQAVLTRMGYGPTKGETHKSPADHYNYVAGPMVREIVQGTAEAGGDVAAMLELAGTVAAASIAACTNFSAETVDLDAFIETLRKRVAELTEPKS